MKALVRILLAAAFVCSFAGLALAANSRSLSPESQTRTINLESQQEVPPNASTATGTAAFTLDILAKTLTVSGSFSGIVGGTDSTVTAAHIHGFAGRGFAAGVKQPLTVVNTVVGPGAGRHGQGTFSGTWSFGDVDKYQILQGNTYVNLHTATNPGGEIRAQIDRGIDQVPALGTWGLALLTLSMLGLGVAVLRMRGRARA